MGLWTYYLVVGFLVCGLVFLIDILNRRRSSQSKTQSRRAKRLPKFYRSPSAVLSTVLFGVFFWPFVLLILIWDAKARKDGDPLGLGGGGYINPKRSWRQYIADTVMGRRDDEYS